MRKDIDDLGQFQDIITEFVATIKNHAPNILKMIISTDVLNDSKRIKAASIAVIQGGADFIKTCTGKTGNGITLEAWRDILDVVKAQDKIIGVKASGGVKTPDFALKIANMAQESYKTKLTPRLFRIGASGLIDELR